MAKPTSELEARFAKLHDKNQSSITLKPKTKVPPPVAKKPTSKSSEEAPIQAQRVQPAQMDVKLFDKEEVKPQSVQKEYASCPGMFDSTLPFSSESESENETDPPVEEVVIATTKESPKTVVLEKVLAAEPRRESSPDSSSDEDLYHIYETSITPGPPEDSHLAQAIQTNVADLLLSSDEEEQEQSKARSSSESSSDGDYYEELHSKPRGKERATSVASSEDGYLTPDEVKRKTEEDHATNLSPKEPRDKDRAPSVASSEDGYLSPDEVKRKDHEKSLLPKEINENSDKSRS